MTTLEKERGKGLETLIGGIAIFGVIVMLIVGFLIAMGRMLGRT